MSSLFWQRPRSRRCLPPFCPAASGMTLPASGPEDIARRVEYIAGEEKLELTPDGAELIARLADGALRDALSILDTCAGVTAKINADVVRRMAGVTDRSYLFRISDALEAQDGAAALAQLAQLRQQSVDVKRLTEELIAHYRALMLAALPGRTGPAVRCFAGRRSPLSGKGPQLGQREAIRAIRALGSALEHMTAAVTSALSWNLLCSAFRSRLSRCRRYPYRPCLPVRRLSLQ